MTHSICATFLCSGFVFVFSFWQQHAVLRETSTQTPIPPPPRKNVVRLLYCTSKIISIYLEIAISISFSIYHRLSYFLQLPQVLRIFSKFLRFWCTFSTFNKPSHTFSTFSLLSYTFSTSDSVSHTFSSFGTLSQTFSGFGTLSHTFSTYSTLSHTFTSFWTLSYTFSIFSTLSQVLAHFLNF